MNRDIVGLLRGLIAEAEKTVPYAAATCFEGESLELQVDRKDEKVSAPKANRGFVLTLFNGEYFEEFATDLLPADGLADFCRAAAASVSVRPARYEIPAGPVLEASYRTEELIPADRVPLTEKLELLRRRRDRILAGGQVVNAMVSYGERSGTKVFVNRSRAVEERIRRLNHLMAVFLSDGRQMKHNFLTAGGTGGLELIEFGDEAIDRMVETGRRMLTAERIEPGFYDVVAAPEVTGLIAHEAFGHGVETDMYLKDRARSRSYLGQMIAASRVNIIDDPTIKNAYGSYFIDDEGEPARPVHIIKDGRFVQGLSDRYSSAVLGLPKTANGRRESFERKIYARMSNTFIAPGETPPPDIIGSVERGVYLEKGMSGMEDPKGWGIQIIILYGREIRDGKLTDRMFSPLGVTGYVPDLLRDISMVGSDFSLDAGTCGKGYKENVPVSAGGPHIRTRVRLG